jgi:hypothetical protein
MHKIERDLGKCASVSNIGSAFSRARRNDPSGQNLTDRSRLGYSGARFCGDRNVRGDHAPSRASTPQSTSRHAPAGRQRSAARRRSRTRPRILPPPGNRVRRPIRTKLHGKKRERGRDSYDFDLESMDLVRRRHKRPVYCVQSWHATELDAMKVIETPYCTQ